MKPKMQLPTLSTETSALYEFFTKYRIAGSRELSEYFGISRSTRSKIISSIYNDVRKKKEISIFTSPAKIQLPVPLIYEYYGLDIEEIVENAAHIHSLYLQYTNSYKKGQTT